GGDDLAVRRVPHRAAGAREVHRLLGDRLVQGLQGGARELRELVEEQDASVGERDLTRTRYRGSAANEAGWCRRVVRRAKRARRLESASDVEARDGMDP